MSASWDPDELLAACRKRPGDLPVGVEPVQSRRIRRVGRVTLRDGRSAYLKVMAFPRAKDRLRYLLRRLPAEAEAANLRRLAAAGIPCPPVLAVAADRQLGLPRLSILLTEALPTAEGPPDFAAVAALAARLADLGCYHPDLNPGNFLHSADGGVAVLDLQSVRFVAGSLPEDLRLAMAVRLVAEIGRGHTAPEQTLVQAGLIPSARAAEVPARAARMLKREQMRWIDRCLQDSSDFCRRRCWNGSWFVRRAAGEPGPLLQEGGDEVLELWVGDRVREVWDGQPALLSALFRKSWWLPGRNRVYHAGHRSQRPSAGEMASLRAAYARYRDLTGSGEPVRAADGQGREQR